jgi:hypothetical protein
MQKIDNQFVMRDIGLQDVPVLNQVRASETVIASIDATVKAFLAGKATVIGPKDSRGELIKYGNNIAHSGKARERVQGTHPDNPKLITYRFEEVKATEKHILTAAFNTRSEFGSIDDLEGDHVKPWVHLVFEDGSQADVVAVDAPKPSKAKAANA